MWWVCLRERWIHTAQVNPLSETLPAKLVGLNSNPFFKKKDC